MKRLYLAVIATAVVAVAFLGYSLGRLTAPPLLTSRDGEAVAVPDAYLEPLLPAPEQEPADVAEEEVRLLVVEMPDAQAAAGASLEISGKAKGGAVVRAELRGDDGLVWSGESTLPETTEFVSFMLVVEPEEALTGPHLLTVTRVPSEDAAAAGEKSEIVTRDVVFGIPDAIKVKVYFISSSDVGGTDCAVVTPVERLVSGQVSVYRATIEQLLAGPTAEEKASGFATSVPNKVQLKAVAADAAGIVTADFSSALDRNVAGSCRVTAIRSQITKTLEQFPEVRGVIIAVDGRVDDALQP